MERPLRQLLYLIGTNILLVVVLHVLFVLLSRHFVDVAFSVLLQHNHVGVVLLWGLSRVNLVLLHRGHLRTARAGVHGLLLNNFRGGLARVLLLDLFDLSLLLLRDFLDVTRGGARDLRPGHTCRVGCTLVGGDVLCNLPGFTQSVRVFLLVLLLQLLLLFHLFQSVVLSELLKTYLRGKVLLFLCKHLVDVRVVIILCAVLLHQLVVESAALRDLLPLMADLTLNVVDALRRVDGEIK